ncbi:hypothetical protein CYY_009270 [Polysphondylium violaceum]|uniref:DUF5898 domain-containing protein n=1 Tax=Polysphondylium violaceum TaxID=133409 RepID=A0A8J4PLZ9_9MYCE|nr:hypothetical protein CYY_009270 [Polysphondylium violaceum]
MEEDLKEKIKQLEQDLKEAQEKNKAMKEEIMAVEKAMEEKMKSFQKEKESKMIKNLFVKIPTGQRSTINHTPSSSKHRPCKFEKSPFSLLENFSELIAKNGEKESSLLVNTKKNCFKFENESVLSIYVRYLLEDTIKILGLEDQISIDYQKPVFDLLPECWFLKFGKEFIGSIEVKVSDDSFDNPKIVGQVFDYAMGSAFHFSKLESFCILTTFNRAAVYFTQQSKDLAQEKKDLRKVHLLKDPMVSEKFYKTVKSKDRFPSETRVLYRSKIYDNTEPENFLNLFCSAIVKMKSSQHDPTKEHSRMRAAVVLTEKGKGFETKEFKIKQGFTELKTLDQIFLKKLYMVKGLGGGGDGFCSLAYTGNGYPVVIKVLNAGGTRRDLEKEQLMWYEMWGIQTEICTYVDEPHLVMPYLKVVSETDFGGDKKEIFFESVKKSCKDITQKGFKHLDLRLRHIAKLKNQKETNYVFIDLSRVESGITDPKKAMEEMMNDLEKDFDDYMKNKSKKSTINQFFVDRCLDRFKTSSVKQNTPEFS